MISRRALPFEFVLSGWGQKVQGWKSSYSLGVAEFGGGYGFSSVMLLSGCVLADAFDTLQQAHAFNKLVLSSKLFVGTPTLEEFYVKAGGVSAAWQKVNALVRKVRKT